MDEAAFLRGGGNDILLGGASGDRFILAAASESIVGAGNIITDFSAMPRRTGST